MSIKDVQDLCRASNGKAVQAPRARSCFQAKARFMRANSAHTAASVVSGDDIPFRLGSGARRRRSGRGSRTCRRTAWPR
eukprot:3709887-Pleurochrysis_carterae.AAC.1